MEMHLISLYLDKIAWRGVKYRINIEEKKDYLFITNRLRLSQLIQKNDRETAHSIFFFRTEHPYIIVHYFVNCM